MITAPISENAAILTDLDFMPFVPLHDPAGFWWVAAKTIPANEVQFSGAVNAPEVLGVLEDLEHSAAPHRYLLVCTDGMSPIQLSLVHGLHTTFSKLRLYAVGKNSDDSLPRFDDRRMAMKAMIGDWSETVVERFSW